MLRASFTSCTKPQMIISTLLKEVAPQHIFSLDSGSWRQPQGEVTLRETPPATCVQWGHFPMTLDPVPIWLEAKTVQPNPRARRCTVNYLKPLNCLTACCYAVIDNQNIHAIYMCSPAYLLTGTSNSYFYIIDTCIPQSFVNFSAVYFGKFPHMSGNS